MEKGVPEGWEEPLAQVEEAVHRGAERVYEVVAGEEDDRSCEAIPEEACRGVPASFVLNAVNGVSTKLAEQLASPGLVLPWLFGAVGAPTAPGTLVSWRLPETEKLFRRVGEA